jgi:hypothetical protein
MGHGVNLIARAGHLSVNQRGFSHPLESDGNSPSNVLNRI